MAQLSVVAGVPYAPKTAGEAATIQPGALIEHAVAHGMQSLTVEKLRRPRRAEPGRLRGTVRLHNGEGRLIDLYGVTTAQRGDTVTIPLTAITIRKGFHGTGGYFYNETETTTKASA